MDVSYPLSLENYCDQLNPHSSAPITHHPPPAPRRTRETRLTRASALPYSLSKDTIEKDLREEAPQWILSCYGPGRDAPEQLFGGYPREQSTDEIRLHYEKGVQAGKQQEVVCDPFPSPLFCPEGAGLEPCPDDEWLGNRVSERNARG